MTRFRSSISLKGAFFQHDPARTFVENLHEMARAMADEGAVDVAARMRGSRAPISLVGGEVADLVTPMVKGGGLAPTTVVVLVRSRGLSAKESIAVRAAGSEVERMTGAFRKTTARMRAARAINRAELLKGIQ